MKKEPDITQNAALLNVITPMGLNFTKNTLSIGENIARVYGITRYTGSPETGWLGKVTGMNDATVSITFRPVDNSELLNFLSRQVAQKRGEAESCSDALQRQRAEAAAENADNMMLKIDRDGETVGLVTVCVMPLGKDGAAFTKQCHRAEGRVAAQRMKLRALPNLQKEGLAHVSPSFPSIRKVEDILEQVMPMSTFIGGFPFATTGFNDGQGYFFAKDSCGGLVILDLWKRGGDRTNSNFVVTGVPGVGKSTTVKMVITNEFMQGTKIIIIDPQTEYRDLTKNLNGDWINLAGGPGWRINPLQVRPAPADDAEGGLNDLAMHMKNLEIFFSLYLTSLDDMQTAVLKKCLVGLYAKFGMTWDTDFSGFGADGYPVFSDLYEFAAEEEKKADGTEKAAYRNLVLMMTDIARGADSFLWNGHTNLSPGGRCVCVDTSRLNEMKDNIKCTQYFNILTWAWELMSRDKTTRYMLVCDEAYLMVNERVPQSLVYLRNFEKQARKFEGSIGLIFHSLSDCLSPAVRQYGEALLDLPCYRILMGTDGKNLRETADLYGLTEAEQELLLAKRRGQALFMAGNKRLRVQFDIPDYKLEYFGEGGGR